MSRTFRAEMSKLGDWLGEDWQVLRRAWRREVSMSSCFIWWVRRIGSLG